MTTTITRLDSELSHPSTSHYDASDTRSFLSQPKTILSPETLTSRLFRSFNISGISTRTYKNVRGSISLIEALVGDAKVMWIGPVSGLCCWAEMRHKLRCLLAR